MKHLYILTLSFFISFGVCAQAVLKSNSNYKITYFRSSDGKPKEDRNPAVVTVSATQNLISNAAILDNKAKYPYEQSIVTKPSQILFQLADLGVNNQIATADSVAIGKQVFELSNDTKVILGYSCKKATTVVNSNRIDLWYTTDAGGGTVIARKVKFPEFQANPNVFVDLTEQSNGDAYDRTGSVFIIPTDKQISLMDALKNSVKDLPVYDNGNGKKYQGVVATANYSPVIELMRFFTPFGVGKYNTLKLKDKNWAEKVYYRQDVSELFPLVNGKEVWVAVFIGNYDKGGHKISLNITLHNGGRQKENKEVILPLFNSTNVMEMAGQEYATMFSSDKGLEVSFTLAKDLKDAKLRYITTGHGGWGNGDEFVPRINTIWLDEKKAFAFTPWRQDCGSYRLSNPASGNFESGLSSSDLSRSNWCPGTVTNPEWISLGDLKAGTHTIKVTIPMGKPEGSSSSAWNVSGVLLGIE
jgi:hypothetical protein